MPNESCSILKQNEERQLRVVSVHVLTLSQNQLKDTLIKAVFLSASALFTLSFSSVTVFNEILKRSNFNSPVSSLHRGATKKGQEGAVGNVY